MGIGGGGSIYIFFRSIFNHVQKIRVQIRFTLEIKNEIKKIFVKLINCLAEKIFLQHSRWTGKRPESTRTFRTPEITGSGRLKRDGNRIAPLYRLLCPFTHVITAEDFHSIPGTA